MPDAMRRGSESAWATSRRPSKQDDRSTVGHDQLEPEYLSVINKLGSGAIYANDGDVRQQLVLEAELLLEVRELFI